MLVYLVQYQLSSVRLQFGCGDGLIVRKNGYRVVHVSIEDLEHKRRSGNHEAPNIIRSREAN
jgi:hypothetical protein